MAIAKPRSMSPERPISPSSLRLMSAMAGPPVATAWPNRQARPNCGGAIDSGRGEGRHMGNANVEVGLCARGERGDLSDPDESRPVEVRHLANIVHLDAEAPLIGRDQRLERAAWERPKLMPARWNDERQRDDGRGVDADNLAEQRRAFRRLIDENPREPQGAFQRNEMDDRMQREKGCRRHSGRSLQSADGESERQSRGDIAHSDVAYEMLVERPRRGDPGHEAIPR